MLQAPDRRWRRAFGRAAVVGALVGLVVVFAVCAGVMLLAGFSVGDAASVGIFTAFWGGPGLGGMFGATIHLARRESLLLVDTASNVVPEALQSRRSAVALTCSPPRAASSSSLSTIRVCIPSSTSSRTRHVAPLGLFQACEVAARAGPTKPTRYDRDIKGDGYASKATRPSKR